MAPAFALCLTLSLVAGDAAAARIRLQVETPGGPDFYVYLARPVGLAAGRPILIAMPDADAAAKAQLDDWYPLAESHRFLVAVPELQLLEAANAAAFDAIFAAVRGRFGMTAERYSVYGHAATADDVQQWLVAQPRPKVDRVVLAAPDRYLWADFEPPPGEAGANAGGPDGLRWFLQTPLTVLLGAAEPATIAAGDAFIEAGRSAAARLDMPFGWRRVAVPGAGNSHRELACAAVPYLLGEM